MNEDDLKEFMQYLVAYAKQVDNENITSEEELQAYAQKKGKQGLQKIYQQFQLAKQRKAKFGIKLDYINFLQNKCPDEYEMGYYKKGGRICKACMKKNQDGNKMVEKQMDEVEEFKNKYRNVKKAACGTQVKKKKDLIPKGLEGLELVQRAIPIFGTYKEAKLLYDHPSWEQAGWTGLSLLGDLSMVLPLVGPEIKAATTAAKAANVAAKLSKASKAAYVMKNANNARKIAHAKTMEDITYPVLYSFTRPTLGIAGRGTLASDENVYNMFGTTKELVDSLRNERLRERYPIGSDK